MQSIFKTKIIALFMTCFLFCLFSLAYAESDLTEGYDENTEVTIKGTVIEIMREMRGPLIVKIRAGNKNYNVVTAPPWYLLREGISFNPDSELEITGSKYFSKDGSLYIIGRQIKNPATGGIILLRDSYCRPLWRGSRMFNRQMP